MICWLCFRYDIISTHAPAGGATWYSGHCYTIIQSHFYSRPCGRGDWLAGQMGLPVEKFLLTPLREGRRARQLHRAAVRKHFYSRPCGRGDDGDLPPIKNLRDFYSRPCGRGDLARPDNTRRDLRFLLTPLREGRPITSASWSGRKLFLLTPLREGRRAAADAAVLPAAISTHAPAGGATRSWRARH